MTASAPPAPAGAAPAARPGLDILVLREQVAMVYATIRLATLGDSALAMIFGAIMYWQMRDWRVLLWMGLHIYNTARLPVLTAWSKDAQAAERAPHWARVYTRELGMNSLTWGLAPILFLPDSLPLVALMMLVVMGLCTSGVVAVAPLRSALYAYILPMISCLVLGLLMRPSGMHFFLMGCTLIFLGTMLGFARAQHRLLAEALRSRFEKQELAEQLERQMRATEAASQQKTRFLASASHDLRQPLHAIALLGAALQKQLAGKPEELNAQRLMSAVGTLGHSLDSMLDVSRLDAGVVVAEPQAVALHEVFRMLNQGFIGAASSKDIQLRVRATELWVHSDPQLLHRLLSNLVDNAIKYTHAGGVLVVARRRVAPARPAEVWLDVVDTGIGIAPEQQARVFEEFYQVGNPGRDRALGLGIGLSIVARLSQLLQHPLELRSVPGRGTRVRLRLPETAPAAVAAAVHPSQPQLRGVSLRARRILVLDDEVDVRTAMDQLLTLHGMQVGVAGDEAEAGALLQQAQDADRPFELLICDFRLAYGADGLQAGQRLVRRFAGLGLLLLTGETSPQRLQSVREAGVPVLFKPVVPERLLQALEAVAH